MPTTIRPSRSHECLSPTIQQINGTISASTFSNANNGVTNGDQLQYIDSSFENQNEQNQIKNSNNINIKLDLNDSNLMQINSIHSSLINQENSFEIKFISNSNNSDNVHMKKYYFMCSCTDERDKWLYILKYLLNKNHNCERRYENTLQLWILEAKGGAIDSTSNKSVKKYYCDILLNNTLYGRTCIKEKKDILFWGENFDFKYFYFIKLIN